MTDRGLSGAHNLSWKAKRVDHDATETDRPSAPALRLASRRAAPDPPPRPDGAIADRGGRGRPDGPAGDAADAPGQPVQSPLNGRYVLDEVVGRGGMATVYRATDLTLNRTVAVKLLHPHLSRERTFVEQFLEVERRVARLFHPHLVTVYDAGAADDGCFVVMEYVAGGSLRERLRAGPVPVAEAVRIVGQIAEALQVLHGQRIVHGDVKPDNVLLDPAGGAKLVDFGIAHLATTTGAITPERLSGTTPYLAPEQVEHGRTDQRSDIYALGLLAYELLAGRPAFPGDTWIAVATQRLARAPEPLSHLRPDVPAEVDTAIRRALARDPEERPPSADAFRGALRGEGPAPASIAGAPAVAASEEEPAQRTAADRPGPGRATAPADPVEWTRLRPRPLDLDDAGPRPAWLALLRGLDPARFRRRSVLLPALGGLALLALLGALALPRLLNPPRPVRVPALVGQSLEAARAAARQAGVQLTIAEESSEAAPRGTVLRQEPAPNAAIQSDLPVRAVVSGGPPPVRVPDLSGRRVNEARQDLAALGLALGKVDQREVAQPPYGAIVAQSARPGSELARGGGVDVVVGLGSARPTPKLVDRALGDAEAELERQGLRLGDVRLQVAAGKRAGTVLEQDPPPETKLRQGESVAVTIAVPPPAARP